MLGRFLQTDPIGYADDLNLYAYVGNNPVNRIDPWGLTRQEATLLASCTICDALPNGAPIVTIGKAIGGVTAAAVGVVTGNDALYNAAVDGLSETRQQNADALILLGTMGRGRTAAKGVGEASSLANAARLRGQLAGKEIAGGHAFEKHVLNQGEFKGLGIRTLTSSLRTTSRTWSTTLLLRAN